MYDIIGDVHGQAGKLRALLAKLGYQVKDGAYRHPQGRQALFLGDLIDRGPAQVEVINIVRNMIEAGSGRTIMGNHEWNAIGFAMRDPEGDEFMRPRTENKLKEHRAFLLQVGLDSPLHKELVAWFKTLPPVLDLGPIRLCHAWWNPVCIDRIQEAMDANGALGEEFMVQSFRRRSLPWEAMERVTKGYEIRLPGGITFLDHNEVARKDIRVRWWDESATAFRQAALVPASERERIPDIPLPATVKLGAAGNVPTFVGHYWLTGRPGVQNATTAVLDYGAGLDGPLVAYRWDGEPQLSNDKLVWVGPEWEMQP
ncbi:MAG: metallophosphoesterase [Sterolibacteriaceae bacterium]|uniref:Metallophosphoesterase n=1 Tax=Candidatus Methylophosphatis roskildensis TaxID=2899263 RepID=A0A9D7HL56_9PROT|nr:metallophosphoesterase [Candidatus Methylophosphatis roskildensis]MBK7235812.1 metallophosphoesterase [Sterolibacteriaceae bacterium]